MIQNVGRQPSTIRQKLNIYFNSPSRKDTVLPKEQLIRNSAETNALYEYHETAGSLGEPETIGFYAARLLTDPNPKVRATAAYLLGELKNKATDALPFLIQSIAREENLELIEDAIKKISGMEVVNVLYSYYYNPTTLKLGKIEALVALSIKGAIPKTEVPKLAHQLLGLPYTPT